MEPKKLYDLKELHSISAGDKGFAREMIELFISQNETAVLELRNHVAGMDLIPVKAILHKLKPSLMVMGVNTVTELVEQVEQLELTTMDASILPDLCVKIEHSLQDVNRQLREI